MRVPDSVRYGGFVPRFQDLVARQVDVQRRIAGGIRILRASDDPGDAGRANLLNGEVKALTQDLRNLDEGRAWTEQTNVVLDRAIGMLQRVNELGIEAGDVTLSAGDRADLAQEVNQLLEGMVDLGALTYRGRTLLSGTETGTPAFTAVRDVSGNITSVTYSGDAGSRQLEISPGRNIDYNTLGSNELGGGYGAFRDTTAGVDLFATMVQMRDFLNANNAAGVTGTSLPQLQLELGHLTLGLARVGGVQSRMEETILTNEDHLAQTREDLSILIETDIAEESVKAAQLDTAYRAALSVGAQIMQTSLLDFLR